jgi:predicted small metal-binding protein
MAKVINCQCGATLRGDSDDELVAAAENHMQTEHPNLVGKMSREQLLSMASDETQPETGRRPRFAGPAIARR